MSQQPVVGVIGLGIMGGAMAEALLAQGYGVVGYDPLPAAQRRLKRSRIATLDCPVSGTAVRMKEGTWTTFASGDEKRFR